MSKFTRKPKAHTPPGVEDFIAGAERRHEVSDDMKSSHIISYESATLPWNQPGIRDDVLKVYNLRLPEAYLLKLKYIAEHTPDSMQKFCLDALLPAIDAKIEQLLKGKG